MGVDLIAPCLALPRDRKPDWATAARWIVGLDPAVVTETGDELFPCEGWYLEAVADGADDPDAPATLATYVRRDMLAAALVRAAIADPDAAGLLAVELPSHRVFFACGYDASPDLELTDAFVYFAESGTALAAGFDHWMQFAWRSLRRRLKAVAEGPAPNPLRWIPKVKIVPAATAPSWLAWIVTKRINPERAEAAIERSGLPAGRQEALRGHVEVLVGYVNDRQYARMIVSQRIAGRTVWVAAGGDQWGERAVLAIRELGAAGILDAIGVHSWGERSWTSSVSTAPTRRCSTQAAGWLVSGTRN